MSDILDPEQEFPKEWEYTFNNRKFYAKNGLRTRSIAFYEVINASGTERYIGKLQFDDPTDIQLGKAMLVAFVNGYYQGVVRGKQSVRMHLFAALDLDRSDQYAW